MPTNVKQQLVIKNGNVYAVSAYSHKEKQQVTFQGDSLEHKH